MNSKLVYSTDTGSHRKAVEKKNSPKPVGPCKMRLETSGRAGKAVTVLFNLPFSEAESKEIMRELQAKLGCGATFKNATIEFRGDMREKIESYFKSKSLKIIRAGG